MAPPHPSILPGPFGNAHATALLQPFLGARSTVPIPWILAVLMLVTPDGRSASPSGMPLAPASLPSPDPGLESLFSPITEGPMFEDSGPFETSFWVDYDGDGFQDLFLTGGFETDPSASGFRNALYRNTGKGTFERVITNATLTATTHAGGQTWGDYDNDGRVDVVLSQWGSRPAVLLRNHGGGVFSAVASDGFSSPGNWPSAVWSDLNQDGFLDLSHAITSRNTIHYGGADGVFLAPVLLTSPGGWGRAAADYDNDGFVDLVLNAAPEGRLTLYRNDGQGSFRQVAAGALGSQAPGFFGMAWGDYDNDGFLDLFACRGPNGSTVLLHNQRDGTFRQVNNSGVVHGRAGWNPSWVDFDNDGHLDLFVTGDSARPSALYRNNGDATFSMVTVGVLATDNQADPYGPAWGDYDHNGFMDLFIPNQGGPHHLYRNNGNANAWVQFKLMGTASNRSGLGAKIRVRATIGGKETWQLRELIAGEGYDGPGTLRLEFGLGDAPKIDLVRVEWPSGTVQELRDVPLRQILTLSEPSKLEAVRRNTDGSVQFTLIGAAGTPYLVEVSNDLAVWAPLLSITNATRAEVVVDSNDHGDSRFYRAVGPAPVALTP